MTFIQGLALIIVVLPFVAICLLVWLKRADGSEWRDR